MLVLKLQTELYLQLPFSITRFESNWWSDWHDRHLEPFYCSLYTLWKTASLALHVTKVGAQSW